MRDLNTFKVGELLEGDLIYIIYPDYKRKGIYKLHMRLVYNGLNAMLLTLGVMQSVGIPGAKYLILRGC